MQKIGHRAHAALWIAFDSFFGKQTFRVDCKMRQTLQYIYILLKSLPFNVTVTSRWWDYWIHLFILNFFHSPHHLYLLRALGTLSLLSLPAGRQNQWRGKVNVFHRTWKGLKLKADVNFKMSLPLLQHTTWNHLARFTVVQHCIHSNNIRSEHIQCESTE